MKRQALYQHITEQFESLEQVSEDLDEYSDECNNSDIMYVMDLQDRDKSILFITELQRAIQSVAEGSDEKYTNAAQLTVSVLKLWNICTSPEDQTVQQMTNLFAAIPPAEYIACRDVFSRWLLGKITRNPNRISFAGSTKKKYIACRDVFSRCLLGKLMRNPNRISFAGSTKKMNRFVSAQYGFANFCDSAPIIKQKLLPYLPVLSHLCGQSKLRGYSIQLVQLLLFVCVNYGVPNMVNALRRTCSNRNAINVDVALVFNHRIFTEIQRRITNQLQRNEFVIVNCKKIKQQTDYLNPLNLYEHLFKNVLSQLAKQRTCDVVRVYIDMQRDCRQCVYPQAIIELTSNTTFVGGGEDVDGKRSKDEQAVCLHSVLMARKRYESDLLKFDTMSKNSEMERKSKCHLNAESEYMMLSSIVRAMNSKDCVASMYLQYGLGIMRFFEEDIYEVLPALFADGRNEASKAIRRRMDGQHEYWRDNVYEEIFRKFRKSQAAKQ
eukprot:CAMPEP_0197079488 /NCGR_PEP_ID=MMETSP1384-20130603/213650_1 /TAXON_ID=29189 /ORGANISM="Ammonia sp." /LENGTH=493 /DNA_ID=CAMNT_0042518365 /DNA_START=337 /DNA_END=1818 /DNA_ORIENTATION=-